jgi:hypothetical protein
MSKFTFAKDVDAKFCLFPSLEALTSLDGTRTFVSFFVTNVGGLV